MATGPIDRAESRLTTCALLVHPREPDDQGIEDESEKRVEQDTGCSARSFGR